MIFLRRSILILLPLSASGCLNVSSVPGPVISAASPFAFTGGGTQITIRGTGFGSGAKVAVDGQPCTSQTIVSSTQINCTLPAHAPGTVAITVTGAPPNNQVATVGTFNYKIDGFTRLDRFAGQPSAMGFADGVGAKAAFSGASQVVTDGTSLYVLDGNMTIRKLDPSTGAVTTFAGRAGGIAGNTTPVDGIGSAAAFNYLSYMAYVSNPNGKFIYVLDYQVPMPPLVAILRQVNLATAQVTTINPGVSISPSGMSSDGANNLFVTSYICAGAGAILKIQVYPSVSSTDCFASGFGVFAIGAAAYDGTNLYISDGGFSIQQVDATAGGVVAPFATSGYAFSNVYSLSYDAGSLYGGEYTDVVKIPVSTGVAEQWAGSATGGEADGVGAAAQFTTAISTSTVLNGSLYFGDSGTSTVRKVSLATAAASTIAGVNGSYGEVDGSATAVKFNGARSVVSDGTYYYVGDFHGGTIRKVNIATGDTSTILSGLAGGAPTRLAMDSTKTNVFYSTNGLVRQYFRISTTGTNPLTIGTGASSITDGNAATATFYNNQRVIASDGNSVYMIDGNGPTQPWTVRQIDDAGNVTSFAITNGAVASTVGSPWGGTILNGNFYFFDFNTYTLRSVPIAGGAVSIVAGNGTNAVSDSSSLLTASFASSSAPFANDGVSLYIGMTGAVRQVNLATGTVTTIAGKPNFSQEILGPLSASDIGEFGDRLGLYDPLKGLVLATGSDLLIVH